jgi:hypothetical protein
MNLARNPYDYYFYDNKGRPIFNGSIYIGLPDLDPEIPANQIDVYGRQEDGTDVLLAQPIATNSGGGATLNGSPIILMMEENFYSLKVLDSLGVQVYYSENTPATLTSELLSDLITVVENVAALASTPVVAGRTYYLKEYYAGSGDSGGELLAYSGSDAPDNGLIFATETAGVLLKRINYTFVTPKMFGAKADGVTNDCDPFRAAIAASKNIYLPEGTYLIEPTADSGDFMLYLGIANGNSDRSGMKIWGQGRKSIIKLGNNVGANKLLFGAASTDVLNNMEFSDFSIDLNAANNLQANFGDPLRYNSAFYLYAKCTNFLFKNLFISNISGHQAIRIGAEDANKYGDDIRLIDVHFENYGIGITGNNQQDVSVCYIQADRIFIQGGSFKNSNFVFDLARGQTALELHGDSSTIVHGVNFAYTQLPVLIVSSYKNNRNVVVEQCIFNECNYFASLDGGELDQTSIKFVDCQFQSTKTASVILPMGNSAETAKSRERVEFINNTVNLTGNSNQDTHLFSIEDNYIKSLMIKGNTIKSINGCLVYSAGTIRNSDVLTIDVSDNHLDSLGSASGSFPNDPAFIYLAHSTGGINSISIKDNQLYNSDSKNYSAVGCYRLTGRILNTTVEGTTGNVSTTYPIVTESSVTGVVTKVIESNNVAIPIKNRSGTIALAGSSSVDLYDFTSFGNNDNAMLEVKIFANVGGTANGTVQSWDVLYSSNGRVIEKETGGGTYNADVILELSGTVLRVRSTTGTALTFSYVVNGDATKSIVWLV